MKKVIIFFLLAACLVPLLSVTTNAEACSLVPVLLNQDPYPATQGEYVKLAFQLQGIENPDCGRVSFELLNKYPIIFDPNTTTKYEIDAGTFKKDYSPYSILTYKVRVDKDAVDGDNPIEIEYSYSNSDVRLKKQFNLNLGDSMANFEVFVKDYNYATKILSLEILNYGKSKVQAILVEIPKQGVINLTGANKNLAGDLDANEYTSAEFTASPIDGSMQVLISYTDSAGIRRSVTKQVSFDSSYFINTKPSSNSSTWKVVLVLIVILLAVYYFYRRNKKRKAAK